MIEVLYLLMFKIEPPSTVYLMCKVETVLHLWMYNYSIVYYCKIDIYHYFFSCRACKTKHTYNIWVIWVQNYIHTLVVVPLTLVLNLNKNLGAVALVFRQCVYIVYTSAYTTLVYFGGTMFLYFIHICIIFWFCLTDLYVCIAYTHLDHFGLAWGTCAWVLYTCT